MGGHSEMVTDRRSRVEVVATTHNPPTTNNNNPNPVIDTSIGTTVDTPRRGRGGTLQSLARAPVRSHPSTHLPTIHHPYPHHHQQQQGWGEVDKGQG